MVIPRAGLARTLRSPEAVLHADLAHSLIQSLLVSGVAFLSCRLHLWIVCACRWTGWIREPMQARRMDKLMSTHWYERSAMQAESPRVDWRGDLEGSQREGNGRTDNSPTDREGSEEAYGFPSCHFLSIRSLTHSTQLVPLLTSPRSLCSRNGRKRGSLSRMVHRGSLNARLRSRE